MTAFNEYSGYYDLLYRDKDYSAEAEFVKSLLRTHHTSVLTVLELGCGTGRHAELLVLQGFRLHGVDRSKGMLDEAQTRKSLLPPEMAEALEVSFGDVRDVRLGKSFDAVISLFHVLSYQTRNTDLEATFATARAHLEPGGIFIFDFWYGPAVLTERPEVRVKRLGDAEIEVTRIAEPVIHPEENCVTVNYEINILRKVDNAFRRFSESHQMRYLFLPEIRQLFSRNGMDLILCCEWMTGKEPGLSTWNVVAVGRVT